MDEVTKFVSDAEILQDKFAKLRREFDKPGDFTGAQLDKFLADIKYLSEEHQKLEKLTVNPVEGVLKGIKYHAQEIQAVLDKLEKGIDKTGEISEQVKSVQELFDVFEKAKGILKELDSDFEEMRSDISEERKKTKTSTYVRNIVVNAMKKFNAEMENL